jgi:hypothetical protein
MSTLHAAAARRPSAKEVAARHREIDRRYKRARPPVDKSKLIAGRRRNEIEDLILYRYYVLPDTDDRDRYLKFWCWHNTRSAHQHEDLKALGRRLGVELPDAEIAATVSYVNRKPRRFSADSLGKQLKLTEDERTLLGITIRLDLAATHHRQGIRRLVAHQVDLSPDQILHRRCATAIRHKLKTGAGDVLEIDAAEVRSAARADRASRGLARVCLEPSNQFRQVLRRKGIFGYYP